MRAGGLFVCTFSNRLFPTKAIRGWLSSENAAHQEIVSGYFRAPADSNGRRTRE